MVKPRRRDAPRILALRDTAAACRPPSAVRRSGYGVLFHHGQSLGVVDYVFGPPPAAGETRRIHLHAPYVSGETVRDQPLTLRLDTGERLDGYCQNIAPSSWLLFRPLTPNNR